MSDQPEAKATEPAPPPPPTAHEAERAPGASGVVYYGAELTFDQAVARRRAGLDVVVRGDDTDTNRVLAAAVEAAVGYRTGPQRPHRRAGPHALPHFHQASRDPDGHSFYETDNPARKARKPR